MLTNAFKYNLIVKCYKLNKSSLQKLTYLWNFEKWTVTKGSVISGILSYSLKIYRNKTAKALK